MSDLPPTLLVGSMDDDDDDSNSQGIHTLETLRRRNKEKQDEAQLRDKERTDANLARIEEHASRKRNAVAASPKKATREPATKRARSLEEATQHPPEVKAPLPSAAAPKKTSDAPASSPQRLKEAPSPPPPPVVVTQVKVASAAPLPKAPDATFSLKGAVFMLSGFVNPERSNLRNALLALGAAYSGDDWIVGKTTHLISNYESTPKFRDVNSKVISAIRGFPTQLAVGASIIKKDWVAACTAANCWVDEVKFEFPSSVSARRPFTARAEAIRSSSPSKPAALCASSPSAAKKEPSPESGSDAAVLKFAPTFADFSTASATAAALDRSPSSGMFHHNLADDSQPTTMAASTSSVAIPSAASASKLKKRSTTVDKDKFRLLSLGFGESDGKKWLAFLRALEKEFIEKCKLGATTVFKLYGDAHRLRDRFVAFCEWNIEECDDLPVAVNAVLDKLSENAKTLRENGDVALLDMSGIEELVSFLGQQE